jgi:hypothetical protein
MKDVDYCVGFLDDPAIVHSVRKKLVSPANIKGLSYDRRPPRSRGS